MPELPEVQSFANALHSEYAGKTIAGIDLHRPDLRFPLSRTALERVFAAGSVLDGVMRVGKQMRLVTDTGTVRVSLGMSGSFFPAEPGKARKHEHITLRFADGTALGYEDVRRFGFWIVEGEEGAPSMSDDAVDATDGPALARLFRSDRVARSTRSVKDFLMDQRYVAGVGNIYALEALFRTGVHPATTCARVKPAQWEALAGALPPLLALAVSHGGSTISTYRRLHGTEGNFQALHLVDGREGDMCTDASCRGVILRIVQSGRSSFFCPRCQKAPRKARSS